MKKLCLLLIMLFAAYILFAQKAASKPQGPGPKIIVHQYRSSYTYVIINSELNTFGYDILDRGHVLIHQPNVPGIPGNKGFTKKQDADKVARLVIKKINNNQMPPTVTQQDIKSLKIIL